MAHYDEKPSVLEAVGNGSFLYRYHISEHTAETEAHAEGEDPQTRIRWVCDEVAVWSPLTANKITEAVIAAFCPASHEQKLVNEYNAATLGLLGGAETSAEATEKIEAYKDFLAKRTALKEQVDADCEALGIR